MGMRLFFIILLALMAPSCGPAKTQLPQCWQAGHLKPGMHIIGTVLLLGAYNQRPKMFPVGCDGGIIADLPDSVTPPLPRGTAFSHPIEELFWKADVAGVVVIDRITGSPSVQLNRISNSHRFKPRWLNGS